MVTSIISAPNWSVKVSLYEGCSESSDSCRVTLFSGRMGINAMHVLTLLHSERPKLYAILVFLSAIGLKAIHFAFTVIINTIQRCHALIDLQGTLLGPVIPFG